MSRTEKPAKHAGGRPSSYKPEYAGQAEKLCQLGATDLEIGNFFEVDVRTINRWKIDYPEFCQSLKNGKAASDERVERSLYNRAVGYTFDSEKVFQFQGEVVRAQTKEHVPPDTTAAIFWLKNRRSKEWRDLRQMEHGGVGDFDAMDDDQLAQEAVKRAQMLGFSPSRKAH